MCKQARKALATVLAAAALCVGLCAPATAVNFGSFSAKAVIPDNQVNKRLTYFDLRLLPEEEQTIQVLVRNSGDTMLQARVELNPAATERGGVIVYNLPDERDETLRVSIEDVASVRQQSIGVPAGGDALIDIDLRMPEQELYGVLLGGIVVTAEEVAEEVVEGGVTLRNEFAYTIGLKITQNDDVVEPDLKLKGIAPGLVNYHPAVSVQLQNTEPVIMKGIEIDAEVTAQADDTLRKTLHRPSAEMAPNSSADFVIDWEDESLQPGVYQLKMTARYEGRLWEWSESFEILPQVAGEVNNTAVGIGREQSRWLPWVLALVSVAAVAGIAVLFFWIGKRRRDKERDEGLRL